MWDESSWQRTLAEIAEETKQARTVQAVCDVVTRGGLRLGFQRARLWLQDDQASSFLLGVSEAGNRGLFEVVGFSMPIAASFYGQYMHGEREPRIFQGQEREKEYLVHYFAEQGLASPAGEWAIVPLWNNDDFLGVLELDYADQRYAQYPVRHELLRLLGWQLVEALDRARLLEQEQLSSRELARLREEEQRRRDELGWLRLLVEVAEDLQHALSIQAVARIVVAGARRLGFRRARLYRLSADQRSLECIRQIGGLHDIVGFHILLDDSVYAGMILTEREPQFHTNRRNKPALIDKRFATFGFDPPVGQWVCMPLWGGRECLGMLVLDNAEDPGLLHPEQRGLLQLFQRQIGAALERARLYEAEQQKRFQRDWLKTLTQVIEETQHAQTVQQVADIIVRRGKWLGFGRARLWRLAEDGQLLIGVSQEGTGELEPFADIVLDLADLPVLSRALQRSELVLSDGRRDNPGVLDSRFAAQGFQPPDGKWVVLPLLNGGHPWGILVLDSAQDDRLVRQEQASLLELFRRQATAALERAQLHEQHAEMLAQLHQMVLHTTAERRDETELLRKIARAALEVLRAKVVILYPMNRRDQSFSIISAGKIDGRTPLVPPDAHDNIVRHIADRRQAYYQTDARGDALLVGPDAAGRRTFTARQGIRSFAGVPLMARGEVLGVMCVNYYERREFGTNEQHLIELFAHQAGAVIAAGQLARTQERRRLKRDLHDAVKSSVRGMLLLAEEARQALASDLDRARFCLHEVQRAGRGILTDVNIILNNLEHAGARKPLNELIEEHLPRHGPRTEIEIGAGVPELPSMLERALLYLIREASANAQTHGRATLIAVRLRCDDGRLRLTIADDGRGFDTRAQATRGHSGLEYMRTRIEEIGGGMQIDSRASHGTTIAFDLPLMEVYDANTALDPSDSDRRG